MDGIQLIFTNTAMTKEKPYLSLNVKMAKFAEGTLRYPGLIHLKVNINLIVRRSYFLLIIKRNIHVEKRILQFIIETSQEYDSELTI